MLCTPNNSNILCSIPLTSGQFSVMTYSNINNVKSQYQILKTSHH